jgi:hypothetical protein
MSYLVIDTDAAATDKRFEQTTQLDGLEYLLTFQWSDRESCWYLDVEDQDGNPLCELVKLVVSWPLLRRFRTNQAVPQGVLACCDMSAPTPDQAADIVSPEELGQRVLLMYITADDPDLQPGGAFT